MTKIYCTEFDEYGGINMEIKKCINCGCFITTNASLCVTCANKKQYNSTVLKNFFDENASFDSISSISAATGVAPDAIQTYMKENDYYDSSFSTTDFSSIQY